MYKTCLAQEFVICNVWVLARPDNLTSNPAYFPILFASHGWICRKIELETICCTFIVFLVEWDILFYLWANMEFKNKRYNAWVKNHISNIKSLLLHSRFDQQHRWWHRLQMPRWILTGSAKQGDFRCRRSRLQCHIDPSCQSAQALQNSTGDFTNQP